MFYERNYSKTTIRLRLSDYGHNHMESKLLKYDWLMRWAFFLNSGQKLLDPDWLRRFILPIRTKYQKYTQ